MMQTTTGSDHAEVVAKIAGLFMECDGMTWNKALTAFMKSDTFPAIVSDSGNPSQDTETIPASFDREIHHE